MSVNRWLTKEERMTAKKNGIPYQTLYKRVYKLHWDIERAIEAPPGSSRKGYIRPKGHWVKLAIENGINERTFYSRIYNMGWSYERAATTEVWGGNAERKKWIVIAEENGICYNTFQTRVNVNGWSFRKAATQKLRNTNRKKAN